MNQYTIFSNTGNWDSDSIGFVGVMSSDDIEQTLLDYAEAFNTAYQQKQFRPSTSIFTHSIVPIESLSALCDENELNCYYEASDDHCAVTTKVTAEGSNLLEWIFIASLLPTKNIQ